MSFRFFIEFSKISPTNWNPERVNPKSNNFSELQLNHLNIQEYFD